MMTKPSTTKKRQVTSRHADRMHIAAFFLRPLRTKCELLNSRFVQKSDSELPSFSTLGQVHFPNFSVDIYMR